MYMYIYLCICKCVCVFVFLFVCMQVTYDQLPDSQQADFPRHTSQEVLKRKMAKVEDINHSMHLLHASIKLHMNVNKIR